MPRPFSLYMPAPARARVGTKDKDALREGQVGHIGIFGGGTREASGQEMKGFSAMNRNRNRLVSPAYPRRFVFDPFGDESPNDTSPSPQLLYSSYDVNIGATNTIQDAPFKFDPFGDDDASTASSSSSDYTSPSEGFGNSARTSGSPDSFYESKRCKVRSIATAHGRILAPVPRAPMAQALVAIEGRMLGATIHLGNKECENNGQNESSIEAAPNTTVTALPQRAEDNGVTTPGLASDGEMVLCKTGPKLDLVAEMKAALRMKASRAKDHRLSRLFGRERASRFHDTSSHRYIPFAPSPPARTLSERNSLLSCLYQD
ncbi:hypothetical protein H0H81_002185 [Sphagnurus paluster]|uniref:Uncharacterized protein n=1 Tax=Sphagnurus paluster TaxID=117069 RepID=A0A9P7GR71_9AGAR|nr:hypothetical protein H0H81_002185 [Sphagnurus paluster]